MVERAPPSAVGSHDTIACEGRLRRRRRRRRRRAVSQRTVWPDLFVASSPTLDYDLSLSETEEQFVIEQFVPELVVEVLAVANFPVTSRLDVGSRCSNRGEPLL